MNYISLYRLPYVAAFALICVLGAYFAHIQTYDFGVKSNAAYTVVCTTTMIADAINRIGYPYANVIGLMGPGVDPHLYRARARTVEQLSSADIIMYHGLHLEGKMVDTLDALRRTKTTVALADVVPKDRLIQSDFEGIYDPHIWHDVSLWIPIVTYIAETLSSIDPEHASHYQQQAEDYCCELQTLDDYIRERCNELTDSERILVTAHDAFAYFGRAYGIEVVALQGMNTDAQISPKDVFQLAQFVIDKHVSTIFFESSIPHRTMQAVLQAVESHGGTVSCGDELYSDALGDIEGLQGTYCAMMKYNCDTIIDGLRHNRVSL